MAGEWQGNGVGGAKGENGGRMNKRMDGRMLGEWRENG
jgi:hypothetical protein